MPSDLQQSTLSDVHTIVSAAAALPLVLSTIGSGYYWWRSLAHRLPLGQEWPLRSAFSGWFLGRKFFTEEGWRYRVRAFWLPVPGFLTTMLISAAVAQFTRP